MKYTSRNAIIFFVIALLFGALAVHLFKSNQVLKKENQRLASVISSNPQREFEPVLDTIYETIVNRKDTLVRKYQIIKRLQQKHVGESSIPVTYLDSVARALKVGEKAITEQTRINADLKKQLTKKDLQISKLESRVYHWKNENAEIIANLKDSTASVSYDAKITVTDYSKKPNWFSRPEYYTAISTDDQDLKINGVQRFEQKIDVKCSRLNFGLQGGLGIVSPLFDDANNIYPGYYLGTGVQFNF